MALKTNRKMQTLAVNGDFAASTELNLANRPDANYTRSVVAHSQRTGARSWKWYDSIGEVHSAISRSARVAGYGKMVAVQFDDAGRVEKELDSGMEAEIVQRIQSPFGGTRVLIERFYTLMKIPGDSYLLEVLDDDGDFEGYHFLSPDEMDLSSFSRWRPGRGHLRWVTVPASGTGIEGPTNSRFTREVSDRQLLGRIWSPSNRWVDLPDSALAALDTECETLYLLTKTIKAKLMSRFATAGILFLPNDISTARLTRNQPAVAGQNIDQTLSFLIAAMTRNQRSFEEAQTWLPIMLRGPGDSGEKIRQIVMDQELFGTDLELRRELIGRILQGLDSNQDTTKGTEGQSHWGAWAASDDERRVSIQPDLETLEWALQRLILHRELTKLGMPPEQVLRRGIKIDLSAASVRANQQEDARQAADRGWVGAKGGRRMSGIPDSDAPDEQEYVRWVGRQVKNPVLMMHGLKEADKIDWDAVKAMPGSTGPAPDSPADDPEAGPGEGDPGSPDDRDTDTPRTQRPA